MAVKILWCLFSLVLIIVPTGRCNPVATPGADPVHEVAAGEHQQRVRVRRQYYVCPPGFERVSSNCYFFSKHMAMWQDAHHECRDRHSELAILHTPAEDKKLRVQLNKPTVTPLEWWIGGIYDWEQMQWKWGGSGKRLTYHGFSRMGPENKEKLKWHCIILDPTLKHKWSARSCYHQKHYICQTKVMRVNKRGLEKLRKKYNNNTLNEIAAPIYQKPIKPRKHNENLSNGHSKTGLKHHTPNGHHLHKDNNRLNNAFGHRKNNTEQRRGKNRDRQNRDREGRKKNRRNRNNKNLSLYVRNGTDFSEVNPETGLPWNNRNNRKNRRNRRNKSKENNSVENQTLSDEEVRKEKKQVWKKENTSMEDITQKTTFMANTISPLHPRLIIEEHAFMDLN